MVFGLEDSLFQKDNGVRFTDDYYETMIERTGCRKQHFELLVRACLILGMQIRASGRSKVSSAGLESKEMHRLLLSHEGKKRKIVYIYGFLTLFSTKKCFQDTRS
ncbi:hypothetical protein RF11_11682 [Thelohanellus kitauei]|uniref:Uncharacterized protein n=1 Tax=Thelohanellus kitauei TaxID=669202 RepID=A0A0C2MDG7_THEKT|nr:hypothetical protein RF11_11682 [Thelohanellus kitauei]